MGWITELAERHKASVRAKVEHPFRVIKHQFGYLKVRYRGLMKNTAQLMTLFALSNLWMARYRLLRGGPAQLDRNSGFLSGQPCRVKPPP
jgi:IS5 family transposase